MTLAQAASHMEASGTQIKIGSFDTFADFMFYFKQHYKPLLEKLTEERAMEAPARRFFINDMLSAFSDENDAEDDEPAQDVYASYSEDIRNAVAYISEQLEPEDKAIIAAKISKNFKQHMNPAYDIDDGKIIDLLEEYGDDHDLPEGWWEEESLDDIVLLLNFDN